MRSAAPIIVLSLIFAFAASGCASPLSAHFFPRLRPLFAGLDETKIRQEAKPSLAQAKADFQLARRGQEPRYARLVGNVPNSQSKVYQGRGYRLTKVRDHAFYGHADGAGIVIEPSITGGKPYRYDEVDEIAD
jgi:hypothetical protein